MSTSTLPPLHTRRPTGRTSWPRIALPGPGGSGKSWQVAQLSASPRVGRTLWLELAERVADEYGKVPGADYELIVHDGSYQSILAELRAAKAHAQAAHDAGELPWVLTVDTVSAFWDMLKNWAGWRARQSDSAKARLRRDPNADIKVSMNIWQDVDVRWREFMDILLTGPWILVMLAKGKQVVAMDDDGRPDHNVPKVYRIEAKTGFDHDAAQIVRLSPEDPPTIVKLRTVFNGIRPGIDDPEVVRDFSLEWLVFERLRFDHTNAGIAETPELHGGGLTDAERAAAEDEQATHHPAGHDRRGQVRSISQTGRSRWSREQQQTIQANAAGWALRCLQLSDVDVAAEAATKIADQWIGEVDMLAHLTEEVRERLGVHPDVDALTLADLGAMVVRYVGKHRRSPLSPLDEPAADVDDARDAADNPDPDEQDPADVRAEEDAAEASGLAGDVPVAGHAA